MLSTCWSAQQTVPDARYVHKITPTNILILLKKTLMPFLGYFVVITSIAQVLQTKQLFDTRNALQHLWQFISPN